MLPLICHVLLIKTQNMYKSCNIGKSTKKPKGIWEFFYVTACLYVFIQHVSILSLFISSYDQMLSWLVFTLSVLLAIFHSIFLSVILPVCTFSVSLSVCVWLNVIFLHCFFLMPVFSLRYKGITSLVKILADRSNKQGNFLNCIL